jgi:hypothetical protein
LVWVNKNFPGNDFYSKSWTKSSKFRGKSKNFRKILMPTDLNLILLKSLRGTRAPFAHSSLRQCYTVIIEKKYQIMWKFLEVFKNYRKKNSQCMKQQIWQNLKIRWHLQFDKFSKSWIKFRFILEKLLEFIFWLKKI